MFFTTPKVCNLKLVAARVATVPSLNDSTASDQMVSCLVLATANDKKLTDYRSAITLAFRLVPALASNPHHRTANGGHQLGCAS